VAAVGSEQNLGYQGNPPRSKVSVISLERVSQGKLGNILRHGSGSDTVAYEGKSLFSLLASCLLYLICPLSSLFSVGLNSSPGEAGSVSGGICRQKLGKLGIGEEVIRTPRSVLIRALTPDIFAVICFREACTEVRCKLRLYSI
jgi:hypothetical protein